MILIVSDSVAITVLGEKAYSNSPVYTFTQYNTQFLLLQYTDVHHFPVHT